MRWTVALAEDAEPVDPPVPSSSNTGRFHTVLAVEDVWSGDGRQFVPDSLTFRDPPLPLMALDSTTMEHMEAVLIGNIDRIERQGQTMHGYGAFLTEPDHEAATLIGLIVRGELRGVSADVDAVEVEIILPADEEDSLMLLAEDTGDGGDGGDEVVIPLTQPKLRVTEGRIMGATVVPFPAFQECFIEVDPGEPVEPLVAAVTIPVEPPPHWFADPRHRGLAAWQISDSGRISGHLAPWEACHVSFADTCRTAPRSVTDYAYFHTGEVRCNDGSRVPVGHISLKGGHAPLDLGAYQAQSWYDDTRSVIADVRCGEDDYGIWVAGALRPGVSPADVRAAMASDVSGDWRRIGGNLELIHITAVNVPGFHKRAYLREEDGLVASFVLPLRHPTMTAERIAERISASIGRDRRSRLRELDARVHRGAHHGLR